MGLLLDGNDGVGEMLTKVEIECDVDTEVFISGSGGEEGNGVGTVEGDEFVGELMAEKCVLICKSGGVASR